MRKVLLYAGCVILLVSCQHELHFPPAPPVVVAPPEKRVTAIIVTNPAETDYDSLVFRYAATQIKEVHYTRPGRDSITRTYSYDANSRLSMLEDEKAIYYTNNDVARRIRFLYNANGELQQTITDFNHKTGINAYFDVNVTGNSKHIVVYDTAYTGNGYSLAWNNRVIYSNTSGDHLQYDSGIFINPSNTSLYKTIVNEYSYAKDSSVNGVSKRVYFNGQLSESGIVSASSDKPSAAYSFFRKKLYRNLANWFEAGLVWQDDNYHIFQLPGGPYASILYKGYSTSAAPGALPYTRDYVFDNSYSNDDLARSLVNYSLLGQGTSKYTTVLRFYYDR